jgi:hypothetical protein
LHDTPSPGLKNNWMDGQQNAINPSDNLMQRKITRVTLFGLNIFDDGTFQELLEIRQSGCSLPNDMLRDRCMRVTAHIRRC